MRATTKEAAPLIVLTLSYKEAAWLMKVMQNPYTTKRHRTKITSKLRNVNHYLLA